MSDVNREYLFRAVEKLDDTSKNILKKCVIECLYIYVMEPKHDFLATMDILYQRMSGHYDKKTIHELSRTIQDAIYNMKISKGFYKQWATESTIDKFGIQKREIPEYVDKIFINHVGSDVNTLMTRYDMFPDLNEEFEELGSEIIKAKNRIYEKYKAQRIFKIIHTPIKHTRISDDDEQKIKFNAQFKQTRIFEKPKPEEEEPVKTHLDEKIDKIQERIRKTNLPGQLSIIQEKEEDDRRIDIIFNEIEKLPTHLVDPENTTSLMRSTSINDMKKKIKILWFGSIKSEELKDDIVSQIHFYRLNTKILGPNVNSDLSRIIIQTFIISLYLNFDIITIHYIIKNIIKHQNFKSINSSIIYKNQVPNKEIKRVIDNILEHVDLTEDMLHIRENWIQLNIHSIDVEDLIDYINRRSDFTKKNRFDILVEIKTLQEKKLQIEYFIKELHKILKRKKYKITENEIRNHVKYES